MNNWTEIPLEIVIKNALTCNIMDKGNNHSTTIQNTFVITVVLQNQSQYSHSEHVTSHSFRVSNSLEIKINMVLKLSGFNVMINPMKKVKG